MDKTWIKLYRQTLNNEVFKHDLTAWHVFEVLMLLADKRKGSWSGGRRQLADWCEMSHNTVYSAILRLEKHQMVNRTINRRYSVYHICNWGNYQSLNNHFVNQPSTSRQHSNKNKNKNIYIQNDFLNKQNSNFLKSKEGFVYTPIDDEPTSIRNILKNKLRV